MRRNRLRKFHEILAVLTIITISLFIVTFADTVVYRSSDVYSYYFNETRAVDSLHTSFSSNEIAGEIAAYFNSSEDGIFRLMENTGYDMEDIFNEDEGRNMLKVKNLLKAEGLTCGVSFIVTFAIYFHLIREDRKKLLSSCYKLSVPLSVFLIVAKAWLFMSGQYIEPGMKLLGIVELAEDSYLKQILGDEFIRMSSKFVLVISILIFIAVTYVCLRLTRQQKLFFRG